MTCLRGLLFLLVVAMAAVAARFPANSSAWSSAVNLSNDAGSSTLPSVAVGPDAASHLVWTDTTSKEIKYSYQPAGGSWSVPLVIGTYAGTTLFADGESAIAAGPDNTAHVVYADDSSGDSEIYYRSLAPGESWTPSVNISNTIGMRSELPDLAVTRDGIVHAVWVDAVSSGGICCAEVYYASKVPGAAWTSPVNLSNSAENTYPVRIGVGSDDSVHVIYRQEDAVGVNIYHSVKAAGGSFSAPDNVTGGTPGARGLGGITKTADGLTHIVYTEGTADVIYRNRLGGAWSAPENVSNNAGGSFSPDLARGSNGTLFLVWQDDESGNYETMYKSRPTGGPWSAAQNLSMNSGASELPGIAAGCDGQLHTVWQDATPGSPDIMYSADASGPVTCTPVSSCSDITASGLYVAASDIVYPGGSDRCLGLYADDITFDCYGHKISGPGPVSLNAGDLIDVTSVLPAIYDGIVVRSCSTSGSGRGFGFFGAGATLANNLIENTVEGMNVGGTGLAILANASFDNTSRGFTIWQGAPTEESIVVTMNMFFSNPQGLAIDDGIGDLYYDNYIARNTTVWDAEPDDWSVLPTAGSNIIGGGLIAGNLWSGYSGADTNGDGIGDTSVPYTNGGQIVNGDSAPLMSGDIDSDGVSDAADNCFRTTNAGQTDTDGDGLGDACESDIDNDGIANTVDNCLTIPNPTQADADFDRIGDACRLSDIDADGVDSAQELACGSDGHANASGAERLDGPFASADDDGDTLVDEALPVVASGFDCDGDGYIGSAEDHVFSYVPQFDGDQKTCREYDTGFSALDPNQTAATPSLRWPSDFRTGSVPDSTNKINILDLASFVAPVRYYLTDVGTHPGDVRWDLSPGKGPLTVDINILDLAAMTAPASATGAPPMLGGVRAFLGPECPWPE